MVKNGWAHAEHKNWFEEHMENAKKGQKGHWWTDFERPKSFKQNTRQLKNKFGSKREL